MQLNPLLFRPAEFQDALETRAVGRYLVYRELTATTMELARRESDEGAPHGTLVLAEQQTAGRGRKGRSFYSPPGENLYFTLVLRGSLDVHQRLPVVVPLAVCQAVREEGVEARIKWPNDIWLAGRKLSGMLIDAEMGPSGGVAFPGIGINVNSDPTQNPELRDIATSLRRELGTEVKRERLLARICNRLERLFEQESEPLVREYRALSLVLGRQVVITPAAGEPYEATARDIAEDGTLVVTRGDGRTETVTAAEVSLRPSGFS